MVRSDVRATLAFAVAVLAMLAPAPPVSAGEISAEIVDGELTVTGTDQDDTIIVRCGDGGVTVNQAPPSGEPAACGDLRGIVVIAGQGADVVNLGDVTRDAFADLTRPQVRGKDGADRLVGSEYGDELHGGGGADRLVSGRGKDLLEGGKGTDQLVAGAASDELRGGPARDELRGGDGNDQLLGGPGDDACVGGPAGDSFLSC